MMVIFVNCRMKDGERVYPFGRYDMAHLPDGSVQLTIANPTPGDTGCYRCVAENDLGSARTTCEVTVSRKHSLNLPK